MEIDSRYMARALQLARLGRMDASPNPMVGAVIAAPDGCVIGEGWHRQVGHGHAEVNAIASVKPTDRHLLRDSTMYVTLEPCSHYGRTPPCSKLIIDTGIPRVVVATLDPFPAVAGRGVAMLREAGVEVAIGVMEQEARELNRRFFLAHTAGRPWVTLKWAMSADGYMDHKRQSGQGAYRFSLPMGSCAVHKLRGSHDAIVTGAGTVESDDPQLDTRLFPGSRNPLRVVVDRRGTVRPDRKVFSTPGTLYLCSKPRTDLPPHVEQAVIAPDAGPADILELLSERGVSSVLVESGPSLLNAFIADGMCDAARIEISPMSLLESGIHPAPRI